MTATKNRIPSALTLIGVAAGVALLGFALQAISVLTAVPSPAFPSGDVSASRASWIQYLGVAGLFIGFIYTAMSYRLARQTRTTDALIAAVGNVGDPDSQVRRAGGVYALGVLVDQDSATRDNVERLLAAFIRDYTRDTSAQAQSEVIDALMLIAKRPRGERLDSRRLDLRGVHLEGTGLYGANLENCDLRSAHLERVDLSDAKLSNAVLTGATLDGANLQGCDLEYALADECSVSDTNFYGANVNGTDFTGTDMTKARNYRPRDTE